MKSKQRAYISGMVLVVMSLLIASVIIGMERAVQDQRSVVAFDRFRQSLGERRALKNHFTEFALSYWHVETGRDVVDFNADPYSEGIFALVTDDALFELGIDGGRLTPSVDSYYPDTPTSVSIVNTNQSGIDFWGGQLLSYGPVEQIGEVTLTMDKNSNGAATFRSNYQHRFDIKGWSVPIFNFPVIAYGKPTSAAGIEEAMGQGTVNIMNGYRPLALTKLDSSVDATAFADLDVSLGGGEEVLPYSYRAMASLCWDTFDYVLGGRYQGRIAASADFVAFDFSRVPDASSMTEGLSFDEATNTLQVEADLLAGKTLFIYDYLGGGNVVLDNRGFTNTDDPIIINIRNVTTILPPTQLTLNRNATGFCVLYANNTEIRRSSGFRFVGAMFLENGSRIVNNEPGDGRFDIWGSLFFPAGSDAIADAGDTRVFALYSRTSGIFPSLQAIAQTLSPRALIVTSTASTR